MARPALSIILLSSRPSSDLSFPAGITLDGDVVHLFAGDAYHQDFLPSCDAAVVSQVEAYLGGLLSGECRMVERHRGGRPAHAALGAARRIDRG